MTGPDRGGPPERVLYVGGWGRSGSTLLDLMLGQVPGFFAAGELRQIWRKGVAENRRCGCGVAFHHCPFWTKVGHEAFGGWDSLDLEEALDLRTRLDRPAALPLLVRSASGGHEVVRYVELLGRLTNAIRSVSGARVIVDSSKTAAHALLLRRIPGSEVRLVHLVRDSRGVVFSWHRGHDRRVASGRTPRRGRTSVASGSGRWLFYNATTPLLRRIGVPYLFLRYEDLVSDPERWLTEVVAHAGGVGDRAALSFMDGHHVTLQPNHIVHGSSGLRFHSGELDLKLDEQWRRDMPGADRAMVTALTLPLLKRFGYPLRTGLGTAGPGR